LTAFFLTLALLLERTSVAWTFVSAVLAPLAAQLVVLLVLNRRAPRRNAT